MDTIFMNSGNSKTSDPHTLIFNLTDKKQGVPKNESLTLIAYKKIGTHGYWLPCHLSILW